MRTSDPVVDDRWSCRPQVTESSCDRKPIWNHTTVWGMRALELIPDLFTVVDTSRTILKHTIACVPISLRVAIAAIGTLNILVVPVLIRSSWKFLIKVGPKWPNGITIFDCVTASELITLLAASVAITALGLKEFYSQLRIPPTYLEYVFKATFPWMGYVIRLTMINQAANIFSGIRFESEINSALSLANRHLTRLDPKDMCQTALKVLAVVKKRRSYLRRANGSEKGLKARIVQLEKRLQQDWKTAHEAIHFAGSFRNRSISYVEHQIFGFGANAFGIGAMLTTHVVGAAILGMVSAAYYLAQTMCSWRMA